jgi:hypothetical protein
MAEGADESGLKVNCNMAQAFESPRETGQRPENISHDVLLPEPSKEFPDTLSRSPLPADPTQQLDR